MKLKLEIRRYADGVVAEDTWPDWEGDTWVFEEGTFACDCNRAIFFNRARNEKEPEVEDVCSSDRFAVRLTDAESGAVLYDEFATDEPDAPV